MLVKGNSKLGRKIYSFDLPAKKTCPGSTPSCRAVCYAANGRFRTHRVQRRFVAAKAASERSAFPEAILALIEGQGVEIVRIHASGDFYSKAYAEKWLKVFRTAPHVKFYFYTRSWRRADIKPVLRGMAVLPNVEVWFSCDKDTGVPPVRLIPKGVRIAYMQTSHDDVPIRADLVFRTHKLRTTPTRFVETSRGTKVPVCPTETGIAGSEDVNCHSCGKCWNPAPVAGRVALAVLA